MRTLIKLHVVLISMVISIFFTPQISATSLNEIRQELQVECATATPQKAQRKGTAHLVFEEGKEWKYRMEYWGMRDGGEDAPQYQDKCLVFKVDGTKNIDGKDYYILKSTVSKWGAENSDNVEESEFGYIHEDVNAGKVSFIPNDIRPLIGFGHYLDYREAGTELQLYDFNTPGMLTSDIGFRAETFMNGIDATYPGYSQSTHCQGDAYCGMYKDLGAIIIDWEGNPLPGVPGDIFGPLRAYVSGNQGFVSMLCSITDSEGNVIFRIPENEVSGLPQTIVNDADIKIAVTKSAIEICWNEPLGQITLTNAQGMTVYSTMCQQQAARIPLNGATGVYILKVNDIVKKIAL